MEFTTIIDNLRILCQNNSELFSITIVIITGLALGTLAMRIKLPEITGYILAGVFLGASGLRLFDESFLESLDTVNHIALGLMALIIGTHINFHKLKSSSRRVLFCFLGEGVFAFTAVLCVFLFVFKQNPAFAMLIAAISISTAPATTLAVVKEIRARGTLINTLMPVVAINNAVCITLFGVFINVSTVIQSGPGNGDSSLFSVLNKSIIDFTLSVVIGIVVGFILKVYSEKGADKDGELLTVVALTVMATTAVADMLVLNPMLPCLVVGIFITNATSYHKRIVNVLDSVQHLLMLLFFAMAGMHFDIAYVGDAGMLGAGYFLARGVGKIIGGGTGAYLGGSPPRVSRYVGFSLLPQSGVAIGLIMLASEIPHMSEHIDLLVTIVLASVAMSEVLGPPMTKWAVTKAGESNQDRPKLIEFVGEEYIKPNMLATNKEEAIAEMVTFLIKSHGMSMKIYDELYQGVLKREEIMTTGIGDGIAVPHGIIEIKGAANIWGSIGISKRGINFNSVDSQKVHLIVLVITPHEHRDKHIKVLSEISRMLNKKQIREELFKAGSAAEFYEILRGLEMHDFNYFID